MLPSRLFTFRGWARQTGACMALVDLQELCLPQSRLRMCSIRLAADGDTVRARQSGVAFILSSIYCCGLIRCISFSVFGKLRVIRSTIVRRRFSSRVSKPASIIRLGPGSRTLDAPS